MFTDNIELSCLFLENFTLQKGFCFHLLSNQTSIKLSVQCVGWNFRINKKFSWFFMKTLHFNPSWTQTPRMTHEKSFYNWCRWITDVTWRKDIKMCAMPPVGFKSSQSGQFIWCQICPSCPCPDNLTAACQLFILLTCHFSGRLCSLAPVGISWFRSTFKKNWL
jgi:hypothetical protein